VNHCWVQNIFVTTGIKQLLQAETGFGVQEEADTAAFRGE